MTRTQNYLRDCIRGSKHNISYFPFNITTTIFPSYKSFFKHQFNKHFLDMNNEGERMSGGKQRRLTVTKSKADRQDRTGHEP